MSSYEGRFVKIGVAFDALYFENEVGDPPNFSPISDIGNSLSDRSESMRKICIVEGFRANVLELNMLLLYWHNISMVFAVCKKGFYPSCHGKVEEWEEMERERKVGH